MILEGRLTELMEMVAPGIFRQHIHVNSKNKKVIYISLSNRPLCPPSILITGWWSSNPRADIRGALVSVPKIMFATLSSSPI